MKTYSPRKTQWQLLPGNPRHHLAIFMLMAAGTVLLYSGDLHLGFFAVDDPGYITSNPRIQGMTADNIRYILTTPFFANYSPVHLLSYMLDHAFGGLDPYAFHLSSNIWAGMATGFVYLTALAITRQQLPAIFAGMLFLAHPVHVEAIVWISSRKDLVATAFALPAFLAYLKYRGENGSVKWYLVSLFLFTLAVAGKLSVATFPAILFAWDLFREKRRLASSLTDKIPFLGIAGIIALLAASAQPSMGNTPDPFILSAALLQNFWLLSGFAGYVLYRVPPEAQGMAASIAGFIFLAVLLLAPLAARKKFPEATVLFYWVLLAFIPSQVLSFTHPVTDRYVYFPSVAAMILAGWGLYSLSGKLGKYGRHATIAITVIISLLWTRATLTYISEWQDPRSVWHAASARSSDPAVFQNLGTHYLGMAERITSGAGIETGKLASVLWEHDPRLKPMLDQWEKGQSITEESMAFANELRNLSWQSLEKAHEAKGNRIMPGLYYNRGLILLHFNNLDGAAHEFRTSLQEGALETFAPVREQLSVYCHYNLGLIGWRKNDYEEAVKWFRIAEEEQQRYGGNWIPGIGETRRKLEEALSNPG